MYGWRGLRSRINTGHFIQYGSDGRILWPDFKHCDSIISKRRILIKVFIRVVGGVRKDCWTGLEGA